MLAGGCPVPLVRLVSRAYNSVRNVMSKPCVVKNGNAIQLSAGPFDNVQHAVYYVLGSLPTWRPQP